MFEWPSRAGGAYVLPPADDPGWDDALVDWALVDWPEDPHSTDTDGMHTAPPDCSSADCLPSGWLALELDTGTAEETVLSDRSLIEAIIGFDRVAAWAMARQARLLAELTTRRPADPVPGEDRASTCSRYAPDEVAVALHLSRGAATARLTLARRLLHDLPATHALWQTGQIDTAKATAIHDATLVVPPDKAAMVQDRVLPRAPQQSLPQLRAALARAVLAVDPHGAADRHHAARNDRRVSIRDEPDGMGSLWALLTAPDAAGAYEWLTRLARGLGPHDPRTMDARRADLLAALLTGQLTTTYHTHEDDHTGGDSDTGGDDHTGEDGGQSGQTHTDTPAHADTRTVDHTDVVDVTDVVDDPGGAGEQAATDSPTSSSAAATDATAAAATGPATTGTRTAGSRPAGTRTAPVRPATPGKPLIQVLIAYPTLIGADDQPAELVGHGPIPAPLAREIAADDAIWHRLLTDPLSGTLLDYGRTTYHPPAALADHIRARDQHCRFPHCRRRAATAELDHTIAWTDDGPTSAANLHTVCPHHHRLKHHAGWRVHAHPDGSLTWTTPTGHQHTTWPHDHRPPPPLTAPPPTAVTPTRPASEADPPPF